MKIITDEVLKLLEVHERILGHFNTCFENQAANEEFQRKRTHNKYKKEIEKTRKLFLALWLKEVNNVVNPPKDKTKVIVESAKKPLKTKYKDIKTNIDLDDVTKAVEQLQNIVEDTQNVIVEDNSTTKCENLANMQKCAEKEKSEETKATQSGEGEQAE